MTTIRVEKISIAELHDNAALKNAIWDLVSPSYLDATAILAREMHQCNEIYFAFNDSNVLCSFFMVGWKKITYENDKIPSVYLGLSATSMKTKNTGIVRLLYSKFIQDAQCWEIEHQQKLILWYTTASPSVFHAVNLLFIQNEPYSDGYYSKEGVRLALAIRQYMNWDTSSNEHPFVLKSVAVDTLYSPAEYERIQKVTEKYNFVLFSSLGINERQRDRLLRIARVPPIANNNPLS